MTEVDVFEAQFRIHSIGSTTQVVALIDSSKFGKVDLSTSLRVNQISHLYTDDGLGENWVNRLKEMKIDFTLCKEEDGINY
jgi:DeoR/GlpR family transcriptional regulator of sugar metabolism